MKMGVAPSSHLHTYYKWERMNETNESANFCKLSVFALSKHICLCLYVYVFEYESMENSTCKNTQKPFLYVCLFASVIRKKEQEKSKKKKIKNKNFPFARMNPHVPV